MLEVIKSFFEGLSANEKKLVYLTGIILGLMLFDRLVIGPIFSESKILDEKIRDQVTYTKKNLRLLEYRERILEEDDSYAEYYTEKGLSREVLIASFLSGVESMAKSSGITLSNINPVNVVPSEGYTELNLKIECQGAMKNVMDFIYNIDNSQKPMVVRSFELAVRNRENYEVMCGMNVVRMIFNRSEIAEDESRKKEEQPVVITERVQLE